MKILMIGPIEKAGGVATHTKELTLSLRRLGVDVEVYNISPNGEYPSVVSALIKLYKRTVGLSLKLLKSSKFDIVHIQASGPLGGFLPVIVGVFWKKILGFNLVATFHYSNTPLFVQKHKRLVSFVVNTSDRFIVVSKKQKEVIESVAKEGKIVVVPNGYDPDKFVDVPNVVARKRLKLPADKRILVNVALLLEKKGQKYLIDAMNIIVNKNGIKDVMCVIIGKGPLYDELYRRVNKYRLQDYVKLTGWIPFEELNLYMNAADLFVLPSLSEGNPTVMFEALGVGLPFVGTTVGGVPEIITSEDYGLLCPPKDPECLAEKILIALEKDWDREKIRKYAEQFTWDRIAEQIVEIYKNIIEG